MDAQQGSNAFAMPSLPAHRQRQRVQQLAFLGVGLILCALLQLLSAFPHGRYGLAHYGSPPALLRWRRIAELWIASNLKRYKVARSRVRSPGDVNRELCPLLYERASLGAPCEGLFSISRSDLRRSLCEKCHERCQDLEGKFDTCGASNNTTKEWRWRGYDVQCF